MATEILTAIVGIILGILAGGLGVRWLAFRRWRQSFFQSLEEAHGKAEEILQEAEQEAERRKQRIWSKAESQARKLRKQVEREKRAFEEEVRKTRHRLEEKEKQLEKKAESLARWERELRKQERDIEERIKVLGAKEQELDRRFEETTRRLEEVSRMTKEEARQELMRQVEIQARHEAAQLIYKMREEARQKADKEARELIATAIYRCAAAHTVDTTVTVVPIPSNDMKGRIIGREGRNIRAFENATGVEVIIDDTPDAVTLSSFDPTRREVARLALERLVQDGRIHPGRIEEVVKKVEEEFEEHLLRIGEETVAELGIASLHPELSKYVGRMKLRTSFGQNLLQHSIEVAKLAGVMASELGLSTEYAKRAGLLHDIGKVAPSDLEGPHALIGGQIAKRYGENDLVVNAIASHHNDVPMQSPIAFIVAAADAVSGSRPGARRESIEYYIRRIQKLEEIAHSYKGVERAFAIHAGRELRVMVQAETVNDTEAFEIARSIAQRIEEEMEYPGHIKVLVIRETRAVEYAR